MNKQDQTLRFISSYIEANGYAPGLRDIKEGLKLGSTSVAASRVETLIKAGLVAKSPTLARSIVILKRPAPIEPEDPSKAVYAMTCFNCGPVLRFHMAWQNGDQRMDEVFSCPTCGGLVTCEKA